MGVLKIFDGSNWVDVTTGQTGTSGYSGYSGSGSGGNPFDQSLNQADSPTFGGVSATTFTQNGNAVLDTSSAVGNYINGNPIYDLSNNTSIDPDGRILYASDGTTQLDYSTPFSLSAAGGRTAGTNTIFMGQNSGYSANAATNGIFLGKNDTIKKINDNKISFVQTTPAIPAQSRTVIMDYQVLLQKQRNLTMSRDMCQRNLDQAQTQLDEINALLSECDKLGITLPAKPAQQAL